MKREDTKTKVIEGFVDGSGEGPEFKPYKEGNSYIPFWEVQGITLRPEFAFWKPATLVIGERGIPESAVRELAEQLEEARDMLYEAAGYADDVTDSEGAVEFAKRARAFLSRTSPTDPTPPEK